MKANFVVKLLVGIVVIGGALGYLVVNAVQSSWAYDISVDDFLSDQEVQAHKARVGGIVQPGSIEQDLEEMLLHFVLVGKDASMSVSYHGTVPDNFEDDREVLVEGQLDEVQVFRAEKVITKCESKYRAKVEK